VGGEGARGHGRRHPPRHRWADRGLISDFGRYTDGKFFELVATVIPLFFLATFAVYLSRKAPARPMILVGVIVADVILGEGVSLYAVAASTATTFLTVACAVALAGQVIDLAYVQVAYAAGSERPATDIVTAGQPGGAARGPAPAPAAKPGKPAEPAGTKAPGTQPSERTEPAEPAGGAAA
jgi:hypothetical protein